MSLLFDGAIFNRYMRSSFAQIRGVFTREEQFADLFTSGIRRWMASGASSKLMLVVAADHAMH